MTLSSRHVRFIGLGSLVALVALMSIQGLFYVSSIEKKLEDMIHSHQVELTEVDGLLREFVEVRGLLTAFVIHEETDISPLIARTNELIEKGDSLATSLHEASSRAAMEEFATRIKEYKAAMYAYSQELLLRRTGEGIVSWQVTLLEKENEAHALVSEVKNGLREGIDRLGADIIRQGKLARVMNIAIGLFGVLAGIAVAFLLQRALTRPVQELVHVSSAVASGDLSIEVEQSSNDEIGVLAGEISSMVLHLRQLVRGLQTASHDMEQSVFHLDQFSQEVAEGASRQSVQIETVSSSVTEMDTIVKEVTSRVDKLKNSLEESSSSTQEMSASTKEVTGHADQMFQEVDQIISSLTQITTSMGETAEFLELLSNSSQQAAQGAKQLTTSVTLVGDRAKESLNSAKEVSRQARERGGAALEKMQEVSRRNKILADDYSTVIESLGERSANIDQILDVIQDVADQTNLLALNAAIIAAGAGEHGRGFAVVAEEIRNLSATTTKNIKQIGTVVEGVREEADKAVNLVGKIKDGMDSSASSAAETGEVLREIEKIASGSSEMAGEISASVAEQVGACEQILELVSQNLQKVIHVRRSADEQKAGSRTIVISVEEIRSIAKKLKMSADEQAAGSMLIADTITATSQFSGETMSAMEAAQEASRRIVSSLKDISQVAEGNAGSMNDLDRMVKDFAALAEKLAMEMCRFKLPAAAEEPSSKNS